MQADNYNYQPDEQFTNKGWNEMRKTLDKEMPVQKKKRRGFFWLFFLIGIFMVGSLAAFYPEFFNLNSSTKANQSQALTFEQPKNEPENIIQNIKEENINQEELINKTSNIQNINPAEKQYNSKSINESRIEEYPSVFDSSVPFTQPEKEEIIHLETEGKSIKSSKLNAANFIEPSFITIELQEVEKLVLADREFFFEESMEEDETIEKEETKERKRELGVFAGTLIDGAVSDKLGLFGGGFINFPIGKKFGFRTGLGYSLLQKDIPYQFNGVQNAEVIHDVAIALIPVSRVQVQSRTDFILKRFHRLDLPGLFTYNPHKKIQIQLGANVSYLIKEKLEVINNSLEVEEYAVANYGIGISAVDLESITLKQYAEEEYWNKFDLSSVVGLAWQPTSKLNIELQYHRGWLPLLSANGGEGLLQLQADNDTRYEVFDNSLYQADFSGNLPSNERFTNKVFKSENLRKFNQSIRLSIGYNF